MLRADNGLATHYLSSASDAISSFLITFEYCKVSFREMYEKWYTDVNILAARSF